MQLTVNRSNHKKDWSHINRPIVNCCLCTRCFSFQLYLHTLVKCSVSKAAISVGGGVRIEEAIMLLLNWLFNSIFFMRLKLVQRFNVKPNFTVCLILGVRTVTVCKQWLCCISSPQLKQGLWEKCLSSHRMGKNRGNPSPQLILSQVCETGVCEAEKHECESGSI